MDVGTAHFTMILRLVPPAIRQSQKLTRLPNWNKREEDCLFQTDTVVSAGFFFQQAAGANLRVAAIVALFKKTELVKYPPLSSTASPSWQSIKVTGAFISQFYILSDQCIFAVNPCRAINYWRTGNPLRIYIIADFHRKRGRHPNPFFKRQITFSGKIAVFLIVLVINFFFAATYYFFHSWYLIWPFYR